ncbi:MAG: hypothetical protein ACREGC_04115, partial [Minisyncoccia bacterium]
MNPNSEAVYRECSFLNDIFPLARVSSAKISRITEELLEKEIGRAVKLSECISIDQTRWFLLNRNGMVITKIGATWINCVLFAIKIKGSVETIGDALHR